MALARIPERLRTAAVLGAAGGINLKPARVGGVRAAVALARSAADRGLDVFVGGMLESGIGRAAALAVASSPACTGPTHLGPSAQYWTADVTEPITGSDGRIDVPAGPGVGRVPDAERLAAATRSVHLVRP